MLDKIPKVFISYSWTTEGYKKTVIELATQLCHDGVMVVLDEWDLKPGHNKYVFMEKSVTDPSIDRVLILCDKKYTEKANLRQGGVGDETVIISPEVYGKVAQEKFIPIIMERDAEGNEFLPAYLRSLMYVDLTGENYASGYEKLLRIIFEQPSKRRPELGKPPTWLTEEESSSVYPLKRALKSLSESNNKRNIVVVQEFLDAYIQALKPFYEKSLNGREEYLSAFKAIKEYRDIFLDFLPTIATEPFFGRSIADILEKLYNTLYNKSTFIENANSCYENEFDIFRVHVWELFVCTVAYMLHFKMFAALQELLVHTYYLRHSALGNEQLERSYNGFCFHSQTIEDIIKPSLEGGLRQKFTLLGHLVVSEREYKPVFTARSIANADLFLYQVYKALPLKELKEYSNWFPRLYIYSDDNKDFWKRLKSCQFCEEILPLFGINTITELKDAIQGCHYDNQYKYPGSLKGATAILDWVKLEEVATLP